MKYREATEWVCDECGLYGERRVALDHERQTGHFVREPVVERVAVLEGEMAGLRARLRELEER